MKKLSRIIIAAFLAVLMAALLPVQALAASPDYVSEVKVAMGSTDSLKGYIILKDDNGNPADLNKDAGGGIGSKGDKAVYLGYKTTKNRSDAITDLALMNMKGGYSMTAYEDILKDNIKDQIIPFVENFLSTINEYRANYNSKNKANKARAAYMHDMLNKLFDDDSGKPLGDLLLEETKYEMGDEEYNKLSKEEKKNHADILTIVSQANGQATLVLQKILTRAADTNTNSWLDRFADTSYDDMVKATGLAPSDARKQLAKQYDDDANLILEKWDELRDDLLTYNDAVSFIKNYKEPDIDSIKEKIDELDEETDAEELVELRKQLGEAERKIMQYNKNCNIVVIHDYLNARSYSDGKMLDYFTRSKEELEKDITALYPMTASFSDGQRAGLEFITLEELIITSSSDPKTYRDAELDKMETASIYQGVDRTIYQKNGVAITTDALREDAVNRSAEQGIYTVPVWLYVMIGLSAAATLSLITTAVTKYVLNTNLRIIARELNAVTKAIAKCDRFNRSIVDYRFKSLNRGVLEGQDVLNYQRDLTLDLERGTRVYAPRNATCSKLMKGFGIAAVVITAVTLFLTWQSIKAHYNVEVTPIPHYMIDEKDLIGYNRKGERVVLKNQAAYYEAVRCNREVSDSNYKMLSNFADMNGDVGSQWLALYYVKNESMEPILSNSFKVVIDSKEVPAGYTKGIHMFGTDSVLNLNNALYSWNKSAKSIMVYFKTDENASTAGSNFTTGTVAIAGGCGIIIGAVVSALGFEVKKKKTNKKVN